jgi:hypothetical protein
MNKFEEMNRKGREISKLSNSDLLELAAKFRVMRKAL